MFASVRFTMKKSCIFIAVCSNLALTLTEGKTQTTLHTTLPNFTIERILPAEKTDSYVVLTFDSLGRPVVSKELDHPRTLIDSDGDGIFESEQVFTDRVRNCQGLWFDNRTLYGTCAPGDVPFQEAGAGGQSGLYRMEDTNGDDIADTFEQVSTFQRGIGEHGPHAIRRGPDGAPTIMIGNYSFVPDEMIDDLSPLRNYKEAQLLQAFPDASGLRNATKDGAQGTVVRLDPRHNQYTLVFGGLRNAYDLAFNLSGEAFTFDSDMEFDINLPWYREVRSIHGIPGGDYGHRNGSGKFPSYYIDSLPPLREVGRGSPVGVEFYHHHVYPEVFHNAYFEADWSRGRILYTKLQLDGATYRAQNTTAEFVHGEPLNITDLEVGPDGMIYFCTGGRGTKGGVYRIRYQPAFSEPSSLTGTLAIVRQPQPLSSWGWATLEKKKASMGDAWKTALEQLAQDLSSKGVDRAQAIYMLQRHGPQPGLNLLSALISDKNAQVRAAVVYVAGQQSSNRGKNIAAIALKDEDAFVRRRAAEALVRMGLSPDRPSLAPVADIYDLLNHDDRFVRYAGRLALERTPRVQWISKVLNESDPLGAIEGIVALTNTASADTDLKQVFEKQFKLMQQTNLSIDNWLRLLRAFHLTAIKTNNSVGPTLLRSVYRLLIDKFPNPDDRLNRELVLTLAYSGQPEVIEAILKAMPSGDSYQPLQIFYVYALRAIPNGWTREQKVQLINWFEKATSWRGGASFRGFINTLFNATLDFFSRDEKRLAYQRIPQFAPLTESELVGLAAKTSNQSIPTAYPTNARVHSVEALTRQEIYEYQLFVPRREPANLVVGQEIFELTCATCHRFGSIGKDLGQDLTTLNNRFQKSDILESILWPSRTISDQYLSMIIETNHGIISGLVEREDSKTLVVRTTGAIERPIVIQKAQVTDLRPSTVSLMPEGLLDEFSQEDIANLIGFLQTTPPR